jgi:hypothetical protein
MDKLSIIMLQLTLKQSVADLNLLKDYHIRATISQGQQSHKLSVVMLDGTINIIPHVSSSQVTY